MTRSPDPGLQDADLQALVVQLGERVKELECLYTVGRVLSATDDRDIALQEVVDAIPPGFQHPDRVAARLRLGDREWTSTGFVSTIVLISGYSHEEAGAGVHRKASAFLPKPFSPEEITRVIRETLER